MSRYGSRWNRPNILKVCYSKCPRCKIRITGWIKNCPNCEEKDGTIIKMRKKGKDVVLEKLLYAIESGLLENPTRRDSEL